MVWELLKEVCLQTECKDSLTMMSQPGRPQEGTAAAGDKGGCRDNQGQGQRTDGYFGFV